MALTPAALDHFADIIDSRDVIARIEHLTDEREAFEFACTACNGAGETAPREVCGVCDGAGQHCDTPESLAAWDAEHETEAAELQALLALADEAEGYAADWEHGETLIRDSYFKDYAQELAEDCGMTKKGLAWPYTCVDWTQAARELQHDYTSVAFAGVRYWVR